jgi:hypothetical protein
MLGNVLGSLRVFNLPDNFEQIIWVGKISLWLKILSQFLLLLCEWDSIRVSLFFKVKISQHMYLPLNPNAMSFAKSVFVAFV